MLLSLDTRPCEETLANDLRLKGRHHANVWCMASNSAVSASNPDISCCCASNSWLARRAICDLVSAITAQAVVPGATRESARGAGHILQAPSTYMPVDTGFSKHHLGQSYRFQIHRGGQRQEPGTIQHSSASWCVLEPLLHCQNLISS